MFQSSVRIFGKIGNKRSLKLKGVALPKISTQFHALHDVGWYVSVYLLTLTAIQPFLGQIDKYFSPKLVYMLSIAMFEGKKPDGW